MSFERHLTEFAGLPVRDFTAGNGSAVQVEPDAVAWRLRAYTGYAYEQDYELDWEAEFGGLLEAFLAQVDTSRVVAIVTGVASYGEAYDSERAARFLIEQSASFPNLRAIFHGDVIREDSDVAYMTQIDPTPLLAAYPDLEALHMRGSFDTWQGQIPFAPLSHSALRTLVFESGGLAPEAIRAVCESDLPRLEHLEFYFGEPHYGGGATPDDIARLLGGGIFPALRHLGLRDAPNQDEIAAAIAHAPIVARLESIDLSLGTLGDEGAAALLGGQPLNHLAKLDLHHHYLSSEMTQRLTEVLTGVEVDLSDQYGLTEWDPNRYIAISE